MSGIILAGGKSTRMGFDKALMTIDGVPMIKRAASALSIVFNDIIICGREYDLQDLKNAVCVPDIYPGIGPIGGIYTGLYNSRDDINFIMACDIPNVDIEVVKYMIYRLNNRHCAIMVFHGYMEPLFGVYRKSILPQLKCQIENHCYKISDLYGKIEVEYIDEHDIIDEVPSFKGLYNINTPSDYEDYRKGFRAKP
jgi:Molybdopterin-guanine dinucleotide biosynthesis protein A